MGIKSPKRSALWRDYRALASLRDRCIHVKSHDWRKPRRETDNLWSELLAAVVPKVPSRATRLIAHYSASEIPRWLQKSGLL